MGYTHISCLYYMDVIMSAMASQITSVSIFSQLFVYVQIKENIKARRHWPLCEGIHRWPVDSPHKGPVTRKMFPFDDVIMLGWIHAITIYTWIMNIYLVDGDFCMFNIFIHWTCFTSYMSDNISMIYIYSLSSVKLTSWYHNITWLV